MIAYTVMKDGTALKTYKTFSAAKKLAEAEGAEVYYDGVFIYPTGMLEEETTVPSETGETMPIDGSQTPSPEGSETTPSEAGQTPPSEGGQTPPADGGETTPSGGGESTTTEGGENTAEGGQTTGETETPEPALSFPARYRLKALMNVRKEPSANAEWLDQLKAGTVVEVASIEEDWLCLTNGTYILYDGGRFAERV